MSLSKRLTLFIGLLVLGTTSAWAACTCGPAPTVQLDMAIGRVVVNPDLAVGSVIATQNWTMPAGTGVNYRCSGTTVFKASIVAPGVTDLGNKVYSTNVPGIGLRFSRGGSTVNIVYPGSFTTGGIFLLKGRVLRWRSLKPRASPAAVRWRRENIPPMTGNTVITRSW